MAWASTEDLRAAWREQALRAGSGEVCFLVDEYEYGGRAGANTRTAETTLLSTRCVHRVAD